MWDSFIPYSMPVYPGVFGLTPIIPVPRLKNSRKCLLLQTFLAISVKMFIITDMDLLNDIETLGSNIRKARKQRGLLQSQLAELASVRRQVVSEIERGTYKGSLRQVISILRAMGLRLTIESVRFPTLDELSDE